MQCVGQKVTDAPHNLFKIEWTNEQAKERTKERALLKSDAVSAAD